MSDDGDVEALLADRRAANPRRTPGRDPVGAGLAPRLLVVTALTLAVATVLLAAVLLAG